MSVRRALVGCTVLSLQDSCVFYPSCSGCLSRIDVESQNTARCFRCGSCYQVEQVAYRYRLSLRVCRDTSIFGITVFGSTLNPFFGINATGLHRLVQNTNGQVEPSVQMTLLLKAAENCFTGRHFIFGLKLGESEGVPWIDGSTSKDTAHFIASQMIPPNASALDFCTVVTCYQNLLQKASEDSQRFADLSRNGGFPAAALLLTPHASSASSFNETLLLSSQRARHLECTLPPTPPWLQPPGIITSSAEQDESDTTQGCDDERSRRTTDHWAPSNVAEKHEVTENQTSLLAEELSFSSKRFSIYTNSSLLDFVGNSPIPNAIFTSSQDGQAAVLPEELVHTLPSTSVVWEDLPFSESLTEFICEENRELDICETEPNLSVQSKRKAARKRLENANFTAGASSDGHRTTQLEKEQSQISRSHIYTPEANRHKQDLSNQPLKDKSLLSFHFEKAKNLYIENDCERDSFNCSADLFNQSPISDVTTEKSNDKMQAVLTTSLKLDQNHPRSENFNPLHSPLESQRQIRNACNTRKSLTLQDFNFVPPSQSTPIGKVSVVFQSSACPNKPSTEGFKSQPERKYSRILRENACEPNSEPPANVTCVLSKAKAETAEQLFQQGRQCTKENRVLSTTPSRCKHKVSTGRRLWKAELHKTPLRVQTHLRVERKKRPQELTEVSPCKRESSQGNFCDDIDSEIPPTPAVKAQPSSLHQRTRQSESCCSYLAFTQKEPQQDEADCPLNSSYSERLADDNLEIGDDVHESRSNDFLHVDESRTCDWSRDLFSDSL